MRREIAVSVQHHRDGDAGCTARFRLDHGRRPARQAADAGWPGACSWPHASRRYCVLDGAGPVYRGRCCLSARGRSWRLRNGSTTDAVTIMPEVQKHIETPALEEACCHRVQAPSRDKSLDGGWTSIPAPIGWNEARRNGSHRAARCRRHSRRGRNLASTKATRAEAGRPHACRAPALPNEVAFTR